MGDASFDAAMDLNVGNDEVRATLNTGGFQFGSTPLLREWIDGSARLGHRRPMLDAPLVPTCFWPRVRCAEPARTWLLLTVTRAI